MVFVLRKSKNVDFHIKIKDNLTTLEAENGKNVWKFETWEFCKSSKSMKILQNYFIFQKPQQDFVSRCNLNC